MAPDESVGRNLELRRHDVDDGVTLDSAEKSHTLHFPILSTYTKWSPAEAFRELVQNWRDGIIESFNIPEERFLVIREERTKNQSTEIVYKVPRPDSEPKEWLGYIMFTGRDGMGTIDITNKNATLQTWHMDMGATSKADDTRQAGTHGDGLKIALLVLQRGPQNHPVRCATGSFSWTFDFNDSEKLVVQLRHMTQDQLVRTDEKSKPASEKSLAPFAAQPDRDVQFLIGQMDSGRDEQGNKTSEDTVSLEEFNKWCETALFLQDVEDDGIVLGGDEGNLVADPRFRGNIYLKGLLLKMPTETVSASVTGKPLKFGYDFQHGTTTRERELACSPEEEARLIYSIWNKVLLVQPSYFYNLSEMLNCSNPEFADVSMAGNLVGFEIASGLQKQLFSGGTNWYYSTTEKAQNPRLDETIHGLGREGVELRDAYWSILEGHGLVRMAQEEEKRRFLATEYAEFPGPFAQDMYRLLRTILRDCPQTEFLSPYFVKANQLSLHVVYVQEKDEIRVHGKWLDRDFTLEELGLSEDLDDVDVQFHSLKRLFSDILDQIPNDKSEPDEDDIETEITGAEVSPAEHGTSAWQRRQQLSLAEQKLLGYFQVKRNLVLVSGDKSNQLLVDWNSCTIDISRNDYVSTQNTVHLHREATCWYLKDALTYADVSLDMTCEPTEEPDEKMETDECSGEVDDSCRTAPQQTKFDRLAAGEEYFALVVNELDDNSIVAVSNTQVTPRTLPPRPDGPSDPVLVNETLAGSSAGEDGKGESGNGLLGNTLGQDATTPSGTVVVGIREDQGEEDPSRKRQRT